MCKISMLKILVKEIKDLKNGFNVVPIKIPAMFSVRHFYNFI